jgi:hypothetical protein
MNINKMWWGYVDLHNKIHVKRYRDDRAIRNAEDSATTIGIFNPFKAENIEIATHMILEKHRELNFFEKKIIT